MTTPLLSCPPACAAPAAVQSTPDPRRGDHPLPACSQDALPPRKPVVSPLSADAALPRLNRPEETRTLERIIRNWRVLDRDHWTPTIRIATRPATHEPRLQQPPAPAITPIDVRPIPAPRSRSTPVTPIPVMT